MPVLATPCTHYDRKVDAALIYFRSDTQSKRTEELDDARFVDYGPGGELVAVELLDVSRGVDLSGLPETARIRVELNRLARNFGWSVRY